MSLAGVRHDAGVNPGAAGTADNPARLGVPCPVSSLFPAALALVLSAGWAFAAHVCTARRGVRLAKRRRPAAPSLSSQARRPGC